MAKTPKQSLNDVERLFQLSLTGERFPGGDKFEDMANSIIDRMNELRATGDAKDVVKAMMLKDPLKSSIIQMIYAEDDPSQIPIAYMRHALAHPPQRVGLMSFAKQEQREKVNGPSKAIRTMCLECMGQETVAVRQCPSVTCMLWPFRMGTNPFFARLNGAEDEATETQEEEDAMEAMRTATPAEVLEAERGNQKT